jgi:hypothetical protein
MVAKSKNTCNRADYEEKKTKRTSLHAHRNAESKETAEYDRLRYLDDDARLRAIAMLLGLGVYLK